MRSREFEPEPRSQIVFPARPKSRRTLAESGGAAIADAMAGGGECGGEFGGASTGGGTVGGGTDSMDGDDNVEVVPPIRREEGDPEPDYGTYCADSID